MRTYANLSAKGLPLGTDYTAAFSGLTVQNLDPLRTTWRELVASASNRPAWRSGAGALACAPGATYRPLSRRLGMVHTSASQHHLDPLRTAWRSGAGALLFVENLPVDNFRSASIVQTAEKIGAVDKVCKCLKTLKIPVNVQKVIHIAHFIRRVLC